MSKTPETTFWGLKTRKTVPTQTVPETLKPALDCTTEAFYVESNLDFSTLFVTQDCFVIKMPRYLAVLSFFEKKFITILQNKRKTDLII